MQTTRGVPLDVVDPLLSKEPAASPPQCKASTKAKSRKKIIIILILILGLAVTVGVVVFKLSQPSAHESNKLPATFQSNGESLILNVSYSIPSVDVGTLMDVSVDPCHDFYQFACGNFTEVFPMPQTKKVWQMPDVSQKNMETTLDRLIHNSLPKWEVFRKLEKVYEGCTKFDRDQVKKRTLTWIVGTMGGFIQNHLLDRSTVFKTNLPKLFRYNLDSLFRLRLGLYTEQKIRQHTVGTFPMSKEIVSTSSKYGIFLEPGSHKAFPRLSVILGFPARKDPWQISYAKFLTNVVNNSLVNPGDTDFTSLISDVIDFERRLVRVTSTDESDPFADLLAKLDEANSQHADGTKLRHANAHDLARLCPGLIEWWAIFREITSAASLPPGSLSTVLMDGSDRRFLTKLCRFLSNELADSSKRPAIQNYLVLKALLPFQLKEAPCASVVGEVMPLAAGKLLERLVLPKETRNVVASLASVIKSEFLAEIKGSRKLATSTKKKLAETVKQLTMTIGYPEWAGYERSLNAFYSTLKTAGDDVGNFVAKFHFELKQKLSLVGLNEHAMRGKMFPSPIYVNAYYSLLGNEIILPPSIIQAPYYDHASPPAFQYGGIGTVLAHEFVHAFERDGQTMDRFLESRNDCVKRHFSTFSYQNKKLRTSVTVGDDIADIAGLQVSYRAYRNSMEPHGSVTLDNGLTLTPDQQFFVAYAQTKCMSFTKEGMQELISRSDHSPGVFRVLGTVSQVQGFGDAFTCSPRTPMNPPGKCQMW